MTELMRIIQSIEPLSQLHYPPSSRGGYRFSPDTFRGTNLEQYTVTISAVAGVFVGKTYVLHIEYKSYLTAVDGGVNLIRYTDTGSCYIDRLPDCFSVIDKIKEFLNPNVWTTNRDGTMIRVGAYNNLQHQTQAERNAFGLK